MGLTGIIIAIVIAAGVVFFVVFMQPYEQQEKADAYKTKIAGINMRTGVRKFAGTIIDCQLVPEPENPHDANAIKIVEATTGTHIGYVPAKETNDVRTFLQNDFTKTHRAYVEEVKDYDDWFLVGEIEIKRE